MTVAEPPVALQRRQQLSERGIVAARAVQRDAVQVDQLGVVGRERQAFFEQRNGFPGPARVIAALRRSLED